MVKKFISVVSHILKTFKVCRLQWNYSLKSKLNLLFSKSKLKILSPNYQSIPKQANNLGLAVSLYSYHSKSQVTNFNCYLSHCSALFLRTLSKLWRTVGALYTVSCSFGKWRSVNSRALHLALAKIKDIS